MFVFFFDIIENKISLSAFLSIRKFLVDSGAMAHFTLFFILACVFSSARHFKRFGSFPERKVSKLSRLLLSVFGVRIRDINTLKSASLKLLDHICIIFDCVSSIFKSLTTTWHERGSFEFKKSTVFANCFLPLPDVITLHVSSGNHVTCIIPFNL